MDSSTSEHHFGPVTLSVSTLSDDRDVVQQWAVARRRTSLRGRWIVALSYLVVLALSVLWLLYVIVPYHLSGYGQLSESQIEWSNIWLWEYRDYPLFTPGIEDFLPMLMFLRLCVGMPILVGLLVELAYKWPAYTLRVNTAKIAGLLVVLGVIALSWQASDKISALLLD